MIKKLIAFILIFSCLTASAQTVDNAVKQTMKPTTDSLKDAISKVQIPAGVVWEEVLIVSVTRAGNVDTLTAPGIYELSVTGNATAVRYVAVSGSGTTLSIRLSNPMAWAGVGSWAVTVVNGRVIVSTTAMGITYQRRKL
jgi:hypothetical protein